MSELVSTQAVMQQIRERIRSRPARLPEPDESQMAETARLRDAVRALRLRVGCVGQVPLHPRTLRAAAGALIVRAVRRALFWYTPALQDSLAGVADGFECQIEAFNRLAAANYENRRMLDGIKAELAGLAARIGRLENGGSPGHGAHPGDGPSAPRRNGGTTAASGQ